MLGCKIIVKLIGHTKAGGGLCSSHVLEYKGPLQSSNSEVRVFSLGLTVI